jgi:hypothetical protein
MQAGGWDVIGLRGHANVASFLGVDIHVDILLNFSGLEMSVLWGPELNVGAQAGLAAGTGVFLGYNAPTNSVFRGIASGLSYTAIYPPCFCGVGLQGEVSGKIYLLGGMIPRHSPDFSKDPLAVAITFELGQEVSFNVGIGYSWMPRILHWQFAP